MNLFKNKFNGIFLMYKNVLGGDMKINIFKESIVGYKNIKRNQPSQDYCDYTKYKDVVICSVADGHSLSRFIYSDIGAKMACQSISYVIKSYIDNDCDIEDIIKDFKIGVIQNKIKSTWNDLVYEHFYSIYYKAYKINYMLYGTTLTSVIMIKNYIIFFNLGDGQILIKKDDNYEFIFENNNYIIVNSMSHKMCVKRMQYKISEIDNKDIKIVVSSDGFTNSFNNYSILKEDLDNTFNALNSNVFTRYNFEKNYANYLNNLSKNISQDDISVMFLYS